MPTQPEKIEFVGSHGAMIAARLDRPSGPIRAYALFAHCFTCSKDIFPASRIAGALVRDGIATLRFDFTGLGHSDGEFANTNFSSNIQDLLAAADWLRTNHAAPMILIGHSLGGTAVLKAAADVPEAVAVVTIGAPANPMHLQHLIGDDVAEIKSAGEAEVSMAGRKFRIQRQFLTDIKAQKMTAAIGKLHKALLVFHAPHDEDIDVENAAAIFMAAKHPKSFISLDSADHLLTKKADAIYVADVLSAWVSRYLPALVDHQAGEAGIVEVVENGIGPFSQDIIIGPHLLSADEPPGLGGTDTGPTPYQLLSAALGACTTMTMRMYANRKGLPLDRARVLVSHDKIHATDCDDCETRDGKVDVFKRDIDLQGPLNDEQRQSLLVIADKCPVHRTLHSEIHIETRLLDSSDTRPGD